MASSLQPVQDPGRAEGEHRTVLTRPPAAWHRGFALPQVGLDSKSVGKEAQCESTLRHGVAAQRKPTPAPRYSGFIAPTAPREAAETCAGSSAHQALPPRMRHSDNPEQS